MLHNTTAHTFAIKQTNKTCNKANICKHTRESATDDISIVPDSSTIDCHTHLMRDAFWLSERPHSTLALVNEHTHIYTHIHKHTHANTSA